MKPKTPLLQCQQLWLMACLSLLGFSSCGGKQSSALQEAAASQPAPPTKLTDVSFKQVRINDKRSEERRVGKECRL